MQNILMYKWTALQSENKNYSSCTYGDPSISLVSGKKIYSWAVISLLN